MELDIGFTGTQIGLTMLQQEAFQNILYLQADNKIFFHHGDCIGADAQAHDIAKPFAASIVIHPPTDPKKRAWCFGGYMLPEKTYLKRNHDIVDQCDILIAAPKGFFEEQRSGTWATIRYALKVNKPVSIIWPTGLVQDGKEWTTTKKSPSKYD